MLDSHTSFRT